MRTILVAVIAMCLAAFPAGMSRASAPVSAQSLQGSTVHPHAEHTSSHEHGLVLAGVDGAAFKAVNHDDSDRAQRTSGGKQCGSTCCGFACHAFEPVLEMTLRAPPGRPVPPVATQDEQVGRGLPFSIERPPRSV